jgi:predicted RNase H-like HicB family nuclease
MSARADTVAAMVNTFTAIFEEAEEGGYIAYAAELRGTTTQGETLEEARENLREAIELILEVNRDLALEKSSGRKRVCETITVEK